MDARELESISRRPLRYWNEDGLTDLLSGVTFLTFGGMSWGMYAEEPSLVAALAPVLFLLGFWGHKVLKKAKERLVFPRTGAVALREPKDLPPKWAMTLVLSVLIITLAMVLPLDRDLFDRWLPIVMGVGLTAGMVAGWHRLGLQRYLLLAAVTFSTTTVLLLQGPRDERGYVTIMVVTGCAMIVTGSVSLVSYLRSAPLAPQDSP